jgi:hypothetical protein
MLVLGRFDAAAQLVGSLEQRSCSRKVSVLGHAGPFDVLISSAFFETRSKPRFLNRSGRLCRCVQPRARSRQDAGGLRKLRRRLCVPARTRPRWRCRTPPQTIRGQVQAARLANLDGPSRVVLVPLLRATTQASAAAPHLPLHRSRASPLRGESGSRYRPAAGCAGVSPRGAADSR